MDAAPFWTAVATVRAFGSVSWTFGSGRAVLTGVTGPAVSREHERER